MLQTEHSLTLGAGVTLSVQSGDLSLNAPGADDVIIGGDILALYMDNGTGTLGIGRVAIKGTSLTLRFDASSAAQMLLLRNLHAAFVGRGGAIGWHGTVMRAP